MGLIVGTMLALSFGFFLTVNGRLAIWRSAPTDTTVVAPVPSAPVVNPKAADIVAPPAITKAYHVIGGGPISVIEYADYACPFSREFHRTMQEIMANNQGKVRWVFRHFPLTSIHPDAESAAEAAECAGDQGKFWEMSDIIFTHQDEGLTLAKLNDYAELSGVKNLKIWNTCVTTKAHADRIQADAQDAEAIGAEGTPYSIVMNDKVISQEVPGALPFSNIQAIIDALSK